MNVVCQSSHGFQYCPWTPRALSVTIIYTVQHYGGLSVTVWGHHVTLASSVHVCPWSSATIIERCSSVYSMFVFVVTRRYSFLSRNAQDGLEPSVDYNIRVKKNGVICRLPRMTAWKYFVVSSLLKKLQVLNFKGHLRSSDSLKIEDNTNTWPPDWTSAEKQLKFVSCTATYPITLLDQCRLTSLSS